jgi:hypothetical protein
MGMEGINWGEVTAQCKQITSSFYNFYEDYLKTSQQLFDDLSNYWASGNATKFGDTYCRHVEENASWIRDCESEIVKILNSASWVYASTFNTHSKLYLDIEENSMFAEPHTRMNNPFQERRNGVTGMNKTKSEEIIEKYSSDITTMLETFSADVCAIEVSILDNQNEQKDAFKAKVEKLCKKLTYDTEQLIAGIHFESLGEINRVDMAKQQTVNTFNA